MKVLLAVLSLMVVSACSTGPGGGYKQPTGTAVGAAAGGLAGAQIGSGSGNLAATAAGALLGAVIGSDIGASLDKADAVYARGYTPGYYAPTPPAFYAPTPAPAYQGGTVTPYAVPGAYAPSQATGMPFGCQRVGNGIWCEQPNGTFGSAR